MDIASLHHLFLASNGISTDTRKLEQGTIFFALKGANFNGNEFAEKALEAGCSHAVIDEEEYANDDRFILVEDVLLTLQRLANHHRKQFDIPVLGITGSNGKTTTKELIGSVLEQKYNLLITEGNLNNHLGVPFTLLRMTNDHDFAVIEMGASKIGDIQELVEIAEPNYGMITNIGSAHIEGFGSKAGVEQGKTEMYRFLDSVNGSIFINADDEILMRNLPDVPAIKYGEQNGEIKGKLEGLTPFVKLSWSYGHYQSAPIETHLVGRYNFTNFLSAVAIGIHFNVEYEKINEALANYIPSNNRSQVERTDRNTLIVDCYNSNPTSMKAAIDSLAEMNHPSKWVIAGDMLELGEISAEEHQNIADHLLSLGFNAILVGKHFQKVNTAFPVYASYEEVKEKEKLSKLEDSLILLKGSRGIKLENLIQLL